MNSEHLFRSLITFLTALLVAGVLIFLAFLVSACGSIDLSSLIEVTGEPTPVETQEVLPSPTQIRERVETEFILVVSQNNTLRGIALEVYGDETRWEEIWEANKDTIDNPNFIRIGQRLRIPNYNTE